MSRVLDRRRPTFVIGPAGVVPREPTLERRIAADRDRSPPGVLSEIAKMHADAHAQATQDPGSPEDAAGGPA